MWSIILLCALVSPLYGSSISPEARASPEYEKLLPKAEKTPIILAQPFVDAYNGPIARSPYVSPLVYYSNPLPFYQRTLLTRAEDSYGGSSENTGGNNNNGWNVVLECVRQNSNYQQYQQYYDQLYNYVNNFPSAITANFPVFPGIRNEMRDEKIEKLDKKPEMLETRGSGVLPTVPEHKYYSIPTVPEPFYSNIDYVHAVNPLLPLQPLAIRARSIHQPIVDQKEAIVPDALPIKAVPLFETPAVDEAAAKPEVVDA